MKCSYNFLTNCCLNYSKHFLYQVFFEIAQKFINLSGWLIKSGYLSILIALKIFLFPLVCFFRNKNKKIEVIEIEEYVSPVRSPSPKFFSPPHSPPPTRVPPTGGVPVLPPIQNPKYQYPEPDY